MAEAIRRVFTDVDRRVTRNHSPLGSMRIHSATLTDLPAIRSAYEHGRAMQRAQRSVVWPEFLDAAIIREIESASLFCVTDDATMAGVFSLIDEDSLRWGDAERGAHLYSHRITRASAHGIELALLEARVSHAAAET